VSDASRLAVYRLTLRSIFDVPLWGYGYGTFAAVFPMYRDRSLGVDGTWGQAHDTYLEVLQGLGLVFGPMLIACVALLVLRCIKGARRRRENAIVPQVAASAACLVGVHSLVDFSLQIQAVALTFVALLGAGVAQSESSRLVLED
jgi:O-antigen ligase